MSVPGKLPQKDVEPSSPPQSAVILLLKDMGDTTWRMFAPTIGLAILGAWVDSKINTGPWLAFIGAVSGTVIAALLIKRQLTKVNHKK